MKTEKLKVPIYISRQKIEVYFDGLSPKTLANRNLLGLSPKPYKRNRKVFTDMMT
jgi:hypothetical protein